LFYIGLYSKNI